MSYSMSEDGFSGKKILLVLKEEYGIPLKFLIEKLDLHNDVGVFFIHPEESFYKKSLYNRFSFYDLKEKLSSDRVFDLRNLCDRFNDRDFDYSKSLNYLGQIEKEYCNFRNLNLQLVSSQLTSRHLHGRFYFNHSTQKQNVRFLELGYRRVIDVLDTFNPDVILDTEDSELLRNIIHEVASVKKIPYITIDYTKFEKYKIPSFNLGLSTPEYLKESYQYHLSLPMSGLKAEIEYIEDFRSRERIMPVEFVNTSTSQYDADSFYKSAKSIIGFLVAWFDTFIIGGNLNFKYFRKILFVNPFKLGIYFLTVTLKRQYLFRSNSFFDLPCEKDSYVYMPLHVIPESTTFVKAPFFVDELNLIIQVAKSLPIGWVLYVKEHQAMVGERSLSFYKKVRRIPNVKLVDFKRYRDPKPWIENSMGVVTISGTAAYEAALFGKRSIVFADVPFSLVDGVSIVRSFLELPDFISEFGPVENKKSCAAYIAAIKAVGSEIDLNYLISEGDDIRRGLKVVSQEYDSQIQQLAIFYYLAYRSYGQVSVGNS